MGENGDPGDRDTSEFMRRMKEMAAMNWNGILRGNGRSVHFGGKTRTIS